MDVKTRKSLRYGLDLITVMTEELAAYMGQPMAKVVEICSARLREQE